MPSVRRKEKLRVENEQVAVCVELVLDFFQGKRKVQCSFPMNTRTEPEVVPFEVALNLKLQQESESTRDSASTKVARNATKGNSGELTQLCLVMCSCRTFLQHPF